MIVFMLALQFTHRTDNTNMALFSFSWQKRSHTHTHGCLRLFMCVSVLQCVEGKRLSIAKRLQPPKNSLVKWKLASKVMHMNSTVDWSDGQWIDRAKTTRLTKTCSPAHTKTSNLNRTKKSAFRLNEINLIVCHTHTHTHTVIDKNKTDI